MPYNFIKLYGNTDFSFKYIDMAKKSSIEQNKLKQRLVLKYSIRRNMLKAQIKNASSLEETLTLQKRLQALPRNSAPTRVYSRCFLTGRPRAVYRDFGLSRHVIREMAHTGLLPGVTKSSW
jgi:small subunit ribosomal protein S14